MATAVYTDSMRAKAEQLANQAHTWARGRSKLDGTGFYVIPGSKPNTAHYASYFGCTCEGYRRRGVCTHSEACKILRRRADEAIAAKVKAADAERAERFARLMGRDDDDTCSEPGCNNWATITGGKCRDHRAR